MKKLGLSRDQYGFLSDHNQVDQFERLFDRVSILTADPVVAEVKTGSAIALTTHGTANLAALTIAAGAWDISWGLTLAPAAATIIQTSRIGLSKTSAALPALNPGELSVAGECLQALPIANPTTFGDVTGRTFTGAFHVSLSVAATLYCVARFAFTISTLSMFGWLRAKRTVE